MNTIQLNSVDKPRRENFTLTWRRIYWVQTALPELQSQWFGKLGKLLRKWKGWGHEEHPQFFRQVTANRWCVSFSLCVYVYLYSPPKKKRKTFVALPEQRGEKGKNEISFAGKLTKANYHLRFGFVLHLLIVLPGCHVDLKVGNTAQHQDIVNPKWNADRKKGRNFNHKNRTPWW